MKADLKSCIQNGILDQPDFRRRMLKSGSTECPIFKDGDGGWRLLELSQEELGC
jgi:hypothetical protein